MTANSKISNLINSQVPFFVRNDHQKFVTFIQKYYEFLEQTDGQLDVKNNILSYKDIDYVSRNDGNLVYNFPYSIANTEGVQNNNNLNSIGIGTMVLKMALRVPANTFTGTDLTLYNFLATGNSNTYNLMGSYADISSSVAGVTAADALQWIKYTTLGTTSNASQDLFAANVIALMIATQNSYPGYFKPDLFNYNTVIVAPPIATTTLETQFQEKLYATFIKLFPKDIKVDKTLLLKHAKEFYLTRGSEKSIRFLLNIIYGIENVEIYYPKSDVLKASDGKWYIQRSLRVNNTQIDANANNSYVALDKFRSRIVHGNVSNAYATVERVDRFFEKGTQIDELVLSGIRGNFVNGELIYSIFEEGGVYDKRVTANVFGGVINSIEITNAGSKYNVGDHPVITTATGKGFGGDIVIDEVSSGNVESVVILEGGAGYRVDDFLLISGGGGSGANGNVKLVLDDSSVHPNSYNIISSQIYLEANTPIGTSSNVNESFAYQNLRTIYTNTSNIRANSGISLLSLNLSSWLANSNVYFETYDSLNVTNQVSGISNTVLITSTNSKSNVVWISPAFSTRQANLTVQVIKKANANTTVANSTASFVYANTGPARLIYIREVGAGYTSTPTISVLANNTVKELGILGKMEIISGGLGYQINDKIVFTNIPNGFGTGAAANVTNVAANGMITQVKFVEVPGHLVGGAGYSTLGVPYYPTANVVSANGSAYGANVVVTHLLGEGGSFLVSNSTYGAIESIAILTKGSNYQQGNTFIDLTGSGDGTAKANISIIEGAFTYPGRYLNDDGFLSSYNFIQDRDYYQNYSYVIRSGASIDNYRKALKELVHPAGMKVFASYITEDMNESMAVSNAADDIVYTANKYVSYTIANNVIINYTAHGLTNANSVYVQFTSGNIANYAANVVTYTPNGIFKVANVINSNAFTVYSGRYLPGSMNVDLVIAETAPTGIYMKENGYNMFVVGTNTDRVFDFKLSRQYDITTAVLDKRSAATSTYDTEPNDLTFKPDGTMLYLTGINNDRITQYSMSEAWNVNTATYLTSFNVSSTSGYTSPVGLNLSRDGKYLYIIDSAADELVQFSMSTAWNVNTASYLTKKYVGGFETNGSAVYFRANGDSLFIVGSTNDVIREFRLSTAWNVNTATIYANSGVLTGFAPSASGLTFANNGSMVYLTDATYDLIHQLPMTEAWNVNTAFNGTTTTGNVIIGKVVSV